AHGSALDLRLDRLVDPRMDEGRYVAAEHGDLLDQGCRDEGVVLPGREKHGFDAAVETSVHGGQLELVFEVGHRAQAPQYDARVDLVKVVDQQPGEATNAHVADVGQRLPGQLDALAESEHRLLARVGGDGDD